MSGECDECARHTLECTCGKLIGPQQSWIKTTERLPEKYVRILACCSLDNSICFAVYTDYGWAHALDQFEDIKITHWMPLPDCPKE